MKQRTIVLFATSVFALNAVAASISVGAAPEGNAKAVASKIIKYNFPACKQVSSAARQSDGSIRATCDGTAYLVFTMYSAAKGKMLELALNCAAAKQYGISACD